MVLFGASIFFDFSIAKRYSVRLPALIYGFILCLKKSKILFRFIASVSAACFRLTNFII